MDKNNIKIDVLNSTGGEYLLTAIAESFEYDDQGRRSKPNGTIYRVVLPKRGFDRLNVKILNKPLMVEAPQDGGTIPVRFEGLTLTLYRTNNSGYDVAAKAESISAIATKA